MPSDIPVIVVGGGISGLACAHFLKRAGVRTLLLEADIQPGGVIRTKSQNGFLVEEGPQSFLCTADLRALVRDLGIEAELLRADSRAPRYILVNAKLLPVPLSLFSFLGSPLLSGRSKWALVRGLWKKTCPPEPDESVAAFVRRKFTGELLDRLVAPMVSGIYAGDPERLSLRAAFPVVHELEQQHGSLIRGALKRRPKGSRERPALSTFRCGNETLPKALAESLGDSLECGARVAAVHQEQTNGRAGFSVRVERIGETRSLRCDALVIAVEPNAAARLLGDLSLDLKPLLSEIESAPVAEVALGYEKQQIVAPFEGFGFLVPRRESLRVLGTVWNSSLFPGRAPEGAALMTSFVGGALDPNAAFLDPKTLVEIVHTEVARVMGIAGRPVFQSVKQYARALPQYNLGHAARIEAIERICAGFPGLWLAGNYFEGPAMGACVKRAARVAQCTREFLAEPRPTLAVKPC
jgi:protoporphyrinogen/coproporphyrinogen III oxidase